MWAPTGYPPRTLISTMALPDGTSEYEVRATIGSVESQATYALCVSATSNANLAGSGIERYRRIEAEAAIGTLADFTDWHYAVLDRLSRYRARAQRAYYRSLQELRTLQRPPRAQTFPRRG